MYCGVSKYVYSLCEVWKAKDIDAETEWWISLVVIVSLCYLYISEYFLAISEKTIRKEIILD
jgi:hypothetical protein